MEGRISLFDCDNKSGKRPHFKGYVNINGEDHEFAVWPAKSGKGFSGNYKPKQQRQEQQSMPAPPPPSGYANNDLDDEIKF